MSGILKVISVVSSLIGISNFIEKEIPEKKGTHDSVVRVAVALNDVNVGFNDADEVAPGQQPTTLQIMASEDGLCIPYISQTWSDGAARGWLGDFGKLCGQSYYYSNIIVGTEHHKPYCTWIDGDHNNPAIFAAAMQIHMEDFIQLDLSDNKTVDKTKLDPYSFCKLPALLFKYKHNYIYNAEDNVSLRDKTLRGHKLKKNDYTLWTGHREFDAQLPNRLNKDPVQRRSPRAVDHSAPNRNQSSSQHGKARGFSQLIVSSDHRHNAQDCCADPKCIGPDMVNTHHQHYCDQSTKTYMPLCNNASEDVLSSDCFHHETHNIVHADMEMRTQKKYTRVEHWN